MSVWENDLTCKPLDTYNEILQFLQNPPSWRTLCEEITPHSKYKIKNEDLVHKTSNTSLVDLEQGAETFCHFDPDTEEVERHDKGLRKTLVCHDMANGYHDDSIIDGTGNYGAYTFYNWAGIDIFCYFSHHLITIPPLAWINVGHAHGVKVIGTLITEWADGIAFWEQVLQSEDDYKIFASALVAIAKTLKFDGWLLNIENKILKPDVLLEFVKYLHETLHEELPDPVLIWYDSVTVEGHLTWQNELNAKNKAFFDACDGLFTNYSWTVKNVAASADAAGDRLPDLYVGIDVWGRNFYGGGQFNVHQAIHVAASHGCSLAIFAPAWTHEAMTFDANDPNTVAMAGTLTKYEHFLLRDRAFWDSFWRYLNTNLPCKLPFKTSFCRGQGKKRRLYGEALCPVPWYNLRHMNYQPSSSHGPHGYMLSSHENIMRLSKIALQKDSEETTATAPQELTEIDSSADIELDKALEQSKCLSATDILALVENKTTNTDNLHKSVDEKPSNLKDKIKSVFKHILKTKSSKNEDDYNDELYNEKNKVGDEDKEGCSREEQHRHTILKNKDVEHTQTSIDQPQAAHGNEDDSKLSVQNIVVNSSRKKAELDAEEQHKISVSDDTHGKPLETSESKRKIEFDLVESEDSDIDTLRKENQSMVQMSVNLQLGRTEKSRYRLAYVPTELQCLEVYFEDSFIGGSCLKLNPSDNLSSEHRFIRLLHCDFFIEDTIVVCVVTKTLFQYEDQFLNVKVFVETPDNDYVQYILVGHNIPSHASASKGRINTTYPVNIKSEQFRNLQKYFLLNEPGFYVPVENSYHWIVRYYLLTAPGSTVTSINCSTGLDSGPILLGHLAVCPMPKAPDQTPSGR